MYILFATKSMDTLNKLKEILKRPKKNLKT